MKTSNVNFERTVLQSVIWDSSINSESGMADEMINTMVPDDFTSNGRRFLFENIKAHRGNKLVVDDAFISGVCNNSEVAGEIGFLENHATTRNLEPYMDKVKSFTALRKSYNIVSKFQSKLEADGEIDAVKAIDDAITELTACNVQRTVTQDFTSESISSQFWYDYEEISKSGDEIQGLKSGLPTLDQRSGGFRGGDLVIIGALPGMGKTTLAVSIIAKMIIEQKSPVLFTYEMSRTQTISNILSAITEYSPELQTVGRTVIERAKATTGGLESVKKALEKYQKAKGYFADRSISHRSMDNIRSTCFKLKAEGRLDALFVDHAGLLVENFNTEREELATISGGLKKLAGELDIPVFLLSQLNERKGERVDRPTMGMLKGSSTLEADADTILFPWRKYAINKEGDESEAILFIGKSRSFSSDDVPLFFDTNTICFSEGVSVVPTRREEVNREVNYNEILEF